MTGTAVDEAESGADRAAEQFVTFYLGDGEFGVPLEDVQEIIRVPELVRVPLSPAGLLGIANLRGAVLPVASLRGAFDLEARDPDDSMRVVVVNRGLPVGVLVDRMSSVLSVDPSEVDDAEELRQVSQSDLVERVVRRPAGRRVMVFDAFRVLEDTLWRGERPEEAGGGRLGSDSPPGTQAAESEAPSDETQLVSFEVESQEYAFPISRVKEIVTLPSSVVSVPRAPSAVVGTMVLRERNLPLVSLRRLLGLPPGAEVEGRRVVVTTGFQDSELEVGVVVDTVREVLRLSERSIDPVPTLLRQGCQELVGICRLDSGRRVVTLLDVEQLMDIRELERSIEDGEDTEDDMNAQARPRAEEGHLSKEEEQFVIFRLDNDSYGIPVESVQEIVRVPDQLTVVPRAPLFVEGVINLRGEVLPVIDQRKRFGLEPTERSDRQRIVVLKARGTLLGFIVDSVAEVRKIPVSLIGPAPALSPEQRELIRRVANLGEERGIILLLEAERMVSKPEMDELETASE